jgi:acetate---CoA ligase (ADP-forming)
MDSFFAPSSVAVIGASREENKVGHVIVKNLVTAHYHGIIYPINPHADKILELDCYPSVVDIPGKVETAIIAVPASLTSQALEQCGEKGIQNIIIVTAGFSEVGNVDLNHKVEEIIAKYHMKMIGPNCLGTLDTRSGFDNLFLPRSRLTRPEKGVISFICQSGAVGSATLDLLSKEGMKFAKFVSYGNAMSIDESDLLEYLGKDTNTKIICMYIEGVKDGKKFMRIAKKVAKKKPIIAVKGGLTEVGARATLSHTASLSGMAVLYKAAFKQSDVIYAETLEDLFNYAKILEKSPKPRGRRVQVITNGGGFGILAADALVHEKMELSEPSKKILASLQKKLPSTATISNPLDLTGSVRTEEYSYALDALMKDPASDMVMLIVLMQTPLISPEILDVIKRGKNINPKKPLIVVSAGGTFTEGYVKQIEELGVPCYTYPHNAARALRALAEYQ